MELSIVIVNWNSCDYLDRCLASIEAQPRAVEREIVVIDSGSFDGCERMLADRHPEVRFLQADSNLGFARANNVAFAESRGCHVLFLNPDTEVIGPAIDTMLGYLMTLPHAGAVGCRLLNGDGSLQTTCLQPFPTILGQMLNSDLLRRTFSRWRIWRMAPLFDDPGEPAVVEAISGACLMLRRAAFERVGGFSEDYFMYAEDIDLCHKLQRAGYRNYYVGQATVRHFGGASSSLAGAAFAGVMMRESIWRFLRKTRGPAYGLAYRASTVGVALARLLVLAPMQFLGGTEGAARSKIGFAKWRAILDWSLGARAAAPGRR